MFSVKDNQIFLCLNIFFLVSLAIYMGTTDYHCKTNHDGQSNYSISLIMSTIKKAQKGIFPF